MKKATAEELGVRLRDAQEWVNADPSRSMAIDYNGESWIIIFNESRKVPSEMTITNTDKDSAVEDLARGLYYAKAFAGGI